MELKLDFLEKLIYTLTMRWYVAGFFIFYVSIGIVTIGWRKLLVHCVIGYTVAMICEAVSIRYGFPFGLYHYVPQVIKKELSIFGVPVWDSLSFVFLTFFPYQMAILLYSPIYKRKPYDILVADTWKIRHSFKVIFTATALMVLIDIIVDPLTLQGKKWFLGHLYVYPGGGSHFGVPVSNYLGWAFTGFVILSLYVLTDKYFLKNKSKFTGKTLYLPSKQLYSLIMYIGIILFNITITFATGLYEIGISSVLTVFFPLLIFFSIFFKKNNFANNNELAEHVNDFPYSSLKKEIE
jgi:putative membrane protein